MGRAATCSGSAVFSPAEAEDGGVRRALATPVGHKVPSAGSRINRTVSSSSDALSGDPTRAAIASSVAGMVQASLLLPMNTVQTQMQTRGMSSRDVVHLLFRNGPIGGLTNLYRAIAPTVGMLGARQGLKFGAGAAFKRRLPPTWPEYARDACAGGLSALTSTTLLFPIDTLKTRWQMNMATPRLDQMYQVTNPNPNPDPDPNPNPNPDPAPYPSPSPNPNPDPSPNPNQGFRPAASYSAFGMALWVMMRNALERNLPG